MPRRLITMKDACRDGQFSRSFAYKLIHKGRITAYKMGRKLMIDADSLDRYRASLPPVEKNNSGDAKGGTS